MHMVGCGWVFTLDNTLLYRTIVFLYISRNVCSDDDDGDDDTVAVVRELI